ncbi:immunoglobulin superfamily member 10 [Protopterus annectens]|uniref:immunoglobulin superfamily member 10 n=1 Tax=Protopterus annectens TaxID=7888 RepID=UPI001CF9CEBB|nr:immunoglobulin superfamily member 10 [Protopterus annectens]
MRSCSLQWSLISFLCLCFGTFPMCTACPKSCTCYVSTEVHCTFRYLTTVPEKIPPAVERINLGYNSLAKLKETDFSGLIRLEILMLHSNGIQEISDHSFSDLQSLQVLKMSYNQVKVLNKETFRGLSSIIRLQMDHNKIEFINPETFYGLTSLKLVHLEGNLLGQLHADTFITLRYIQLFKTSTIKHIYLSDNFLTHLPKELFSNIPDLESVYLHGNPLSCDCNMKWFVEWVKNTPGVLKCKRDRGQLSSRECPICFAPKIFRGKHIEEITPAALSCSKPLIDPLLKLKNATLQDVGELNPISPRDFMAPMGSMILNLTDLSGNEANLVCNVQKPTEISSLTLDEKDDYTGLNTSFLTYIVCIIDYEHIQTLWKILAVYSDAPLRLERDLLLTMNPYVSYKYKQSEYGDDGIYTGVEAELRADPTWLMQKQITFQLDRTATTLSTLHIKFIVDAHINLKNAVQAQQKYKWTMIKKHNTTRTEFSVVAGGALELHCPAIGEPSPAIEWILPDGSKVRAPYSAEDGRITINTVGTLFLKAADSSDVGIYHCIATNYGDADILSFRIMVFEPDVEDNEVNGLQMLKSLNDPVYLACRSTGIPDASVTWILPDHTILYHSSGHRGIDPNGTLKIQGLTNRDRGYYRCLTANMYGIDVLTSKILLTAESSISSITNTLKDVSSEEETDGSGNYEKVQFDTLRKHVKENPSTISDSIIHKKRFTTTTPQRNQPRQTTGMDRKNVVKNNRKLGRKRVMENRRGIISANRRVDPQKWAEFLEKAKKHSETLNKKAEVRGKTKESDFLRVSGDGEDSSGEQFSSPDEQLIVWTTKIYPSSPMTAVQPTIKETSTAYSGISLPAVNIESAMVIVSKESSPIISPVTMQPTNTDNNNLEIYSTARPSLYTTFMPRASTLVELREVENKKQQDPAMQMKATEVVPDIQITSSGESNEDNKSTLPNTTPYFSLPKPATEKHELIPDSADKESAEASNQVTFTAFKKANNEKDKILFHSTQKMVSPRLPLGSSIITQQEIQIVRDVSPKTPISNAKTGRRRRPYGRRRYGSTGEGYRINGHRYKIVRPLPKKIPVEGTTIIPTSSLTSPESESSSSPALVITPLPSPVQIPALIETTRVLEILNADTAGSTTELQDTAVETNDYRGQRTGTTKPVYEPNHSEVKPLQFTSLLEVINDSEGSKDLKNKASISTEYVTSMPLRISTRKSYLVSTFSNQNEASDSGMITTKSSTHKISSSTSKPTTASKIIFGKIPWHRFLSGKEAQKEILKKLRPPIPKSHKTTMVPPVTNTLFPSKDLSSNLPSFSSFTKHKETLIPVTQSTRHTTQLKEKDQLSAFLSSSSAAVAAVTTPLTTTVSVFRSFPTNGYFHKKQTSPIMLKSTVSTIKTSTAKVERKPFHLRRSKKKPIVPSMTTKVKPTSSGHSKFSDVLIKYPDRRVSMANNQQGTLLSSVTKQKVTTPTIKDTASTTEVILPVQAPHITVKPVLSTTEQIFTTRPPTTKILYTNNALIFENARTAAPGGIAIGIPEVHTENVLKYKGRQLQTELLHVTAAPKTSSYSYKDIQLSTKLPFVLTNIHKPVLQQPTLSSNITKVMSDALAPKPTLSSNWDIKFWTQPLIATSKKLPIDTLTITAAPKKFDKDVEVTKNDRSLDSDVSVSNVITVEPLQKSRPARPRILGGNAASFTVLANSDAVIPCDATGNPVPLVKWTKIASGTTISTKAKRGNKYEVFQNGTLFIQNANVQDRGQYLCIATNQYGSDRLLVTLSVVAYSPRILEPKLKDITVQSESNVEMKCRAEGRPLPTISWILANKTIIREYEQEISRATVLEDGTLVIKNVGVYDRGHYKCIANNPAGIDSITVKLQVVAAPPLIVEEKKQQITGVLGQNLLLPCTAKGRPQPSVHWLLPNGKVIKPLQLLNGKVLLFANGTLYIRQLSGLDGGKYECIALSSTGSERRVVSISVVQRYAIPQILFASPETTEINYGGQLMLNCSAIGDPKPRIIWRLPSKAIVDQFHRMGNRITVLYNGTLIIESVTEKDAGEYLCVARNNIGDDLLLMKVRVTTKPAKIEHKHYLKKQVPYGKDFQVDCKATGSPQPDISWSLPDGTLINNIMQADDSGRRFRRYVLFDNGTLYLNKVEIAEEGDYTCYAQNTVGKDEMKVHISVVSVKPYIKERHKTNVRVKAGDMAVFHCESNGEPKPKIFWLLPSRDIISSSIDRYLLHVNGSLSISNVKLSDSGEYFCIARNAAGDDTKPYVFEVISNPPIINGLYINKTVIKDTAVKHSRKQIDCKAESNPPPQTMWIMPDNIFLRAPYYGSRIVVHLNGTLEIRNVRPSDTGEFICVARNDGGETVMVVQLEVIDMLRRPLFKNPFNEKVITRAGKTTILNCSADGYPPPEIVWLLPNGTRFINGQKLSQYFIGSNGTFIIYNPTKHDAGKYRCAARNQVGYIEKLIILEVGQQPVIYTHPKGLIKSISGDALLLHCLASGIPKPKIAWTLPNGYTLDRPQINRKYMLLENGTLVVRETNVHDRGNYICKAQNEAGDSIITVPVIVIGYPPRITNVPPPAVHTIAGAIVQLNCIAVGIPKPEIIWELPNHSVISTVRASRSIGNELIHPQGTLVIPNPKPSDSGTYRCIAKNHLGSDIRASYLQVISSRRTL